MTEGSIVLLPEIKCSGSHPENYAVVKSVINDDILEISILGSKEVIFIANADVKVVKWQGRKAKSKKVNKKTKKVASCGNVNNDLLASVRVGWLISH